MLKMKATIPERIVQALREHKAPYLIRTKTDEKLMVVSFNKLTQKMVLRTNYGTDFDTEWYDGSERFYTLEVYPYPLEGYEKVSSTFKEEDIHGDV